MGGYGKDLGFVILIAAAFALLVAQARMAPSWSTRARSLARLGVCASGVGRVVLLAGLAAALLLERPWFPWFGPSPAAYWAAGMMLTLAGAALLAIAMVLSPDKHTLSGVLVVTGAVPLALALVLAFDEPHRSEVCGVAPDGSRTVIAARVSAPHKGWFTADPLVGISGAAFGMAWMVIGIQESRVGRGPRRGAPRLSSTA